MSLKFHDVYKLLDHETGGVRVLYDANRNPLTQKEVQGIMHWLRLGANVKPGVYILRHTFCSHLSMRSAPAKEPDIRT